jgi:hypothetical protein
MCLFQEEFKVYFSDYSLKKQQKVVKRLKRGSLASKVTSLEISWSAYKGEFKDFERLPTK